MPPKEQTLTPEQQIEALKTKLAEQQAVAAAEAAAKDAIIEGQAEKLKEAEAQGQEGRLVITHERKQYRVLAKQFDLGNGETVQAEELKTNKELVADLLKRKSGLLQLVEAAEEAK